MGRGRGRNKYIHICSRRELHGQCDFSKEWNEDVARRFTHARDAYMKVHAENERLKQEIIRLETVSQADATRILLYEVGGICICN